MNELTYLDPPVELLATSPRKEMLVGRMRNHGLRPIPVGEAWTDGSLTPLLVDVASVSPEALERLEGEVREGTDRTVILLTGSGAAGIDLHNCLHLKSDEDVASLSSRIELRRRRETRNSETRLRRETARQLGGLDEWRQRDGARTGNDILYLGDSGQFFQALRHGFKQAGHDLVAALSVPTAETFLRSGQFALVCLNAAGGKRDVLDLIERISLGQLMLSAPIALISDAQSLLRDPACLDVADEFISSDEPNDAIVRSCIAAMAKGLPSTAPSRVRLSSTLFDAHTRLYSREFLDAHLPEQIRECSRFEAPLCLLSLKVNPGQPAAERAAQVRQLAHIITGDLRVTDLAARAGATEIVVSLRETPYSGAVKLAKRIQARVNQTAAMGPRPDFSWRITEWRASLTADAFLDAALKGSFMRAIVAA